MHTFELIEINCGIVYKCYTPLPAGKTYTGHIAQQASAGRLSGCACDR